MEKINMLDTVDTIETESINYKDCTKEQLIEIIHSKDVAFENLQTTMKNNEEKNQNTIDNICAECDAQVKRYQDILGYYDRKINLIKDILKLERGEE